MVHNEDHKRHVDKHCGTCGPFGPVSSSGFVQLQIYNIHDPYIIILGYPQFISKGHSHSHL